MPITPRLKQFTRWAVEHPLQDSARDRIGSHSFAGGQASKVARTEGGALPELKGQLIKIRGQFLVGPVLLS